MTDQNWAQAKADLVSLVGIDAPHEHLWDEIEPIILCYPNQLYGVVLKRVTASGAVEGHIHLKPTKLFGRLMSAIRADDRDEIRVIHAECEVA